MVIGADTGFFIQLAKGVDAVKEMWNRVCNGEETLVISVLSLHELSVYFYRKGTIKEKDVFIGLMKQLPTVQIIPVSSEIAEQSAKYKHSLGIPSVDSLILTTFILEGCTKAVSTDAHFKKAEEQKLIKVELV